MQQKDILWYSFCLALVTTERECITFIYDKIFMIIDNKIDRYKDQQIDKQIKGEGESKRKS